MHYAIEPLDEGLFARARAQAAAKTAADAPVLVVRTFALSSDAVIPAILAQRVAAKATAFLAQYHLGPEAYLGSHVNAYGIAGTRADLNVDAYLLTLILAVPAAVAQALAEATP